MSESTAIVACSVSGASISADSWGAAVDESASPLVATSAAIYYGKLFGSSVTTAVPSLQMQYLFEQELPD
jgi:hypothetical protein